MNTRILNVVGASFGLLFAIMLCMFSAGTSSTGLAIISGMFVLITFGISMIIAIKEENLSMTKSILSIISSALGLLFGIMFFMFDSKAGLGFTQVICFLTFLTIYLKSQLSFFIPDNKEKMQKILELTGSLFGIIFSIFFYCIPFTQSSSVALDWSATFGFLYFFTVLSDSIFALINNGEV